jgi:hypothetical protein
VEKRWAENVLGICLLCRNKKNVITECIRHITELTRSRTKNTKNTELKSMTLITETNTLIYRMFSFTQKAATQGSRKTNNQKVAYC